MIKGKASYPFETIALAVAFSPRLEALIAETKRLSLLFNVKVVFIHVGKRTSEKERHLSSYLLQYDFNDSNCIVQWENGNPVDTILAICKKHIVDLLIIGALEKENLLKYYAGSISREISRRAKCSVMMLTEPDLHPVPVKNIVVNGHDHTKTIHSIETALYFAGKEGVSEILVVDEMEIPSFSMSLDESSSQSATTLLSDVNPRLSALVESLEKTNTGIRLKMISGKKGESISKFAESVNADLLVVNSPDHHLNIFDRIFSHDLENVLADLPCNMLIVHSRVF